MALDKWTWSKDTQYYLDQLGDIPGSEEADASLLPPDDYSGPETTAFNTEQVKEIAEVDLNFFAGMAIPLIFKVFFPPVLLAAWQLLRQSITDTSRKEPKLALGIPRGHAKTTLIKLFALWCILFTKRQFILVISSTADRSEDIISDIADMLNESNIISIFGDWKLTLEIDRTNLKVFHFKGRSVILASIGAGGSLRGMNIKNVRPDVMLFDDVQTKENAESQSLSLALEKWMVGTAMKAKSPHGCMFIFAGNMYPTPNSILLKLKDNATWIKFISGAILADGTALWPELRSYESLIEELDGDISLGHPEIFFSEVMNDITAGTNSKTDLGLIREWQWTEVDKPQGKFILIDPASNKTGGDTVAIGYCEVYDGFAGLRDIVEEMLSPGDTIRKALIMALRTGTRCIAVESTAYQYSLLYWFTYISEQLGLTGFHFVEIYTGNYSKNARITDMLKTLTAGQIFVHQSVKSKVVHQIVHWNPMKRNNSDGILDVLSYMPRVLELYAPILQTEETIEMIEAKQDGSRVLEDNSAF